jgi:FkbM family methyltransferase
LYPDLPHEVRPSLPVRLIRRLPFGRLLALKIFNRFLFHFHPKRSVTTYYGAQFDCDARDLIQLTMLHFGVWEPNTSRVFSQLIKPGDVVADLGANIGYFTLLFSRLVGPAGRVIAIEGLPRTVETLQRNVARNAADNVRIVNVAVGAEPSTVTMYEGPSFNRGTSTVRPDRGYKAAATVDALPLDRILSDGEAKRTRLIKIDIEGAEIPVVTQILDNLDRYSPVVMIAVEANAAENREWVSLFQRFHDLGFLAYDLGNRYAWPNLMDGGYSEPALLAELPDVEQVDILFTRSAL